MFEELYFRQKKAHFAKLLDYGFQQSDVGFQYEISIMQGQFLLRVFINHDEVVSTQMIDHISGEEYVLYKIPSSVGSFVGEVRAACEVVLMDISNRCFEPCIFHSEQALELISFVRKTYRDELEFLWKKSPNNAIWRRQDTRKWYCVILTVSRRKLGLASDEIIEIIDLRLDPSKMAETVDQKIYFPGWHMNKKTWYTIILDGSVSLNKLYQRIDDSYHLAIK